MGQHPTNQLSTDDRREDWETPQWLFDELNKVFNFKIDLAASKENSKVETYFSENYNLFDEDRAISTRIMDEGEYAFMNPPFQKKGKTGSWVKCAVELVGDRGLVCIVPASVGSKWWSETVWALCDSVVFPRRFSYKKPGNELEKSGAMFDSAICIKEPRCRKDSWNWDRYYEVLTRLGALVEITK